MDVRLVKNFKGLSKGFGYVEFKDPVSNTVIILEFGAAGLLNNSNTVIVFEFGPVSD